MAAVVAASREGVGTPTGGRVLRSAGMSMLSPTNQSDKSLEESSDKKDKTVDKKSAEKKVSAAELLGEAADVGSVIHSPDAKAMATPLKSEKDEPPSRTCSSSSLTSTVASSEAVVKRPVGALRSRKLTIDTKINSLLSKDADNGRLVERAHPAVDCCTPGTVASVWGETSDQDKYQPFFSGKAMNFHRVSSFGDLPHDIGVHCQRGQKPQAPNQDDFFILQRAGWLLCGVADGHGANGHDVAHFVQENLPKCFLSKYKPGVSNDWREAASASFLESVDKMKAEIPSKCNESGATASMVLISRDKGKEPGPTKVRTAFVGDSLVVHAKKAPGASSWEVSFVTSPHRPDREDELARIEAAKGEVVVPPEGNSGPPRLRVPSGDMAMSRALGDLDAHAYGLIAKPEVPEDCILEDDADHLILICSDGVWDMIEPREAVGIVAKFAADDSQRAAERLAAKAQSRWQQQETQPGVIDDITVILIRPGKIEGLSPVKEGE
eukprot:gb/GFBE01015864.1/.p1 GENE.gb/GFBE01015864.1/~~gb/GFBE01015864.1/.p1  ORF type:complete len:495 (+),score=105.93 gb/GFBE01015864.1/:1-1485(+)